MEALCALLAACAADLWPMLPKHKVKRFYEFHARPDGVRWADMIRTQLYGHPPSTGPRYHHESVVKWSHHMTDDNLCVFHFEGNSGRVYYNPPLRNYHTLNDWGTITVVITKTLNLKVSFYKRPPPHISSIAAHGYVEPTKEEIDTEVAEVLAIMNEWFLVVLRKVFQLRIKQMKEELAAAVWHPARVAKWMEAGVELECM